MRKILLINHVLFKKLLSFLMLSFYCNIYSNYFVCLPSFKNIMPADILCFCKKFDDKNSGCSEHSAEEGTGN
jgi:hypothetical protein